MPSTTTTDAPSKIVISELRSIVTCIFLQVYEYFLPRIDQEDKHTRRGFQADGEHCCSSGFIQWKILQKKNRFILRRKLTILILRVMQNSL